MALPEVDQTARMYRLAHNFSILGGLFILFGIFSFILFWKPNPDYLTMLLYFIPEAILALGIIFVMYAAVFWWQFIRNVK